VSDLRLFRVADGQAAEIPGAAVALERHLQTLIERNMEATLGIRFLASEYSTGSRHRGRIDSLGLDECGNPVIIEYKRSNGKVVITQALSYLSWLRDHRHEFESLVKERLGEEAAGSVDWSNPRLVCIAGNFTSHDTNALEEIGRRIDLVSYRDFGGGLLALQLVASVTGSAAPSRTPNRAGEHECTLGGFWGWQFGGQVGPAVLRRVASVSAGPVRRPRRHADLPC
jgi:hypothetical protein